MAIAKALDLLADCRGAHRAAPGHLRRQWNQALGGRLVVYAERIPRIGERGEGLGDLRLGELPDQLDGEAVTGTGAFTAAVRMRSF